MYMPDKVGNSPADELVKLRNDLAANQSKVADMSKDSDRLRLQIADLAKAVADIDAKAKAFDKASQDVSVQQKEFDTYVKTKKQMLEATVPNKDAIVKAKRDGLQHLSDLEQQVQDLSAKVLQQEKVWTDAKAETAKKQAAYAVAANLAAANDAVLKDLSSLKSAADKEGSDNRISRMYFLVLLMEDVLNKVSLPSSADYQKGLNQAANDAAAAAVADRVAKEELDKADADRQQAQKDFDDTKAKWRQQTLDAIVEPKPAVVPVGTARRALASAEMFTPPH
jgi:hypothetical protein